MRSIILITLFLVCPAIINAQTVNVPVSASDIQKLEIAIQNQQQDEIVQQQAISNNQRAISEEQSQYSQDQQFIASEQQEISAWNAAQANGVNWDSVAMLKYNGVNWSSIQASNPGVNWYAVGLANGTQGVNWSDISPSSYLNFFPCEAKGVNWSSFILNNESC